MAINYFVLLIDTAQMILIRSTYPCLSRGALWPSSYFLARLSHTRVCLVGPCGPQVTFLHACLIPLFCHLTFSVGHYPCPSSAPPPVNNQHSCLMFTFRKTRGRGWFCNNSAWKLFWRAGPDVYEIRDVFCKRMLPCVTELPTLCSTTWHLSGRAISSLHYVPH